MIHNIKNNIDSQNIIQNVKESNIRNLSANETFIRKAVHYIGRDEQWIDLSSHNSLMNNSTITDFNTDVTINVPNQSKVLINCHIGVCDNIGNSNIHLRLGKKVDGVIVWGSTSGITSVRDDEQTDPKGDNTDSTNPSTNRLESWDFIHCNHTGKVFTMNPFFIDENPTNSLTGNHDVTYFIRIRMEFPEGSNDHFNIGQSDSSSDDNRQSVPTILTIQEIGGTTIL